MNKPPSTVLARSGIVALVGRANVGKSTLMNRVLGEKVSIVSPVAQTTRNAVRGVLTEARGQLVFLDTPGMHKATHDLGRRMNQMARAAVEGVDVVVLLVDVSLPPREEDRGWLLRLPGLEAECVVACNKSDQGRSYEQAYRNAWAAAATERPGGKAPRWFVLSALTGEGVGALLDALFENVPVAPPLFPEDVLTDFPRNWAIADVIREKLIVLLRDEIPHAVAVRVNAIEEAEDPKWTIRADVIVDKPSQKGIVIGRKGRILRTGRQQAEKELSAVYEKDVHLDLWVKVEKNWARNHWILKQLGYVPS